MVGSSFILHVREWFLAKINEPDSTQNQSKLSYWRNRLFIRLLAYVLILSLFGLVASLIASIKFELFFLAIYDVIVYLIMIYVFINPHNFSFERRKIIFLFNFYALSWVLLWQLETLWAPGIIFLFALTIISSLILKRRFTIINVILNIVTCTAYTFIIYFDIKQGDTAAFVAVSTNFIFLSTACAISVNSLFSNLYNTLLKERQSKTELNRSISIQGHQKRELEQFVFIANHDLREPITILKSINQLIRKASIAGNNEGVIKLIEKLNYPIEKIEAKTNGLLNYSMIGQMAVLENIRMSEILEELLNECQSSFPDKKLKLTYKELGNVDGYRSGIKSLFYELIINSIQYSKSSTIEVSIFSQRNEGHVLFFYKDNGIGISEHLHQRVFQLFQTGHSNESVNTGWGVGLSICQKVVELHNGKIWIENSGDNGTTIAIRIPQQEFIDDEKSEI